MTENLRVSAVIPAHNRADLLRRMLETAAAQSIPFEQIIVVDNNSADGVPSVAREFGCRVLPMHENAGFARAVNAGWRAASTEWVAVLNSDIELDPQWLRSLLLAASAANASFATGLMFDFTRRHIVDGTYDLVSRAGCAWRAGHGEPLAVEHKSDSTAEIAIAPGTACIFRRSVLEQLGGYDESFESYLEDIDLGLRCVRAGFHGIYVPSAIAFHHGSATLGRWNPRVVRLISRNQLRLIAKHYDRALLRRSIWHVIAGQLLWGAIAARHGAFWAWLLGKIDGLRTFRLSCERSGKLEKFLARSEAELRHRARDTYWRWYFRFTGNGSAAR